MVRAKVQRGRSGEEGSLLGSLQQAWPELAASPARAANWALRCANQLVEAGLFAVLVGQTVHVLSSGERRFINLRHLLIKWILYLLVLLLAEQAKQHTLLDELFIFLCNLLAAALVYPSQFLKSLHLKYLSYSEKKTYDEALTDPALYETTLFTRLLVSVSVFLLNVLRLVITFIPLAQRRKVEEAMKEVNMIIVEEKYFGKLYDQNWKRESEALGESKVNLYDSKARQQREKPRNDNCLRLRAEEHIEINLATILASEQGRRKFAYYREIELSYNAESTELTVTSVEDGKAGTVLLEEVVMVDEQMVQLVSEEGQEAMFVKFKSKKDKELFINYIYLES